MANPLYQKIAEDLREQIESGALAVGTRLPTELDLCDQYNASQSTVRDAIKRMITLGLVEAWPGQGIFVAQKTSPFVTTLTIDPANGFGDSYLRGELSGSFSIADGITRNTIVIPRNEPSDGFWQQGTRTKFSYSHELSHEAARNKEHSSSAKFIQIRSADSPWIRWEGDRTLSAFSKLQQSATQLLMRYSEDRVQLQAVALASMLASILIVATAIFSAIRSIFRFIAVATIIVRMLMAHRNSREPAYSLTSYLPLYQSLAGVALA